MLISASRDPDAKLTFVIDRRRRHRRRRAARRQDPGDRRGRRGRRPRGPDARRRCAGSASGRWPRRVPRYVDSLDVDGRPVLVSTAVPGVPMSIGYHRWGHTARPAAVRRDVEAAFGWLGALPGRPRSRAEPHRRGRRRCSSRSAAAGTATPRCPRPSPRLERAVRALAGSPSPAHRRARRLLVRQPARRRRHGQRRRRLGGARRRWARRCATPVRFVLSYGLYLDRHTRPGHRVLGHPRLRRTGFAPGVGYALCGAGWFPDLVRRAAGRATWSGSGSAPASGTTPRWSASARSRPLPTTTTSAPGTSSCWPSLPLRARRHRRATPMTTTPIRAVADAAASPRPSRDDGAAGAGRASPSRCCRSWSPPAPATPPSPTCGWRARIVVAALWVTRERLPLAFPYAVGVTLLLDRRRAGRDGRRRPASAPRWCWPRTSSCCCGRRRWRWAATTPRSSPRRPRRGAGSRWCYSGVVLVAYLIGFSPLTGVTAQDGVRASYTFGDPNLAGNYLVTSLFMMAACQRPRGGLHPARRLRARAGGDRVHRLERRDAHPADRRRGGLHDLASSAGAARSSGRDRR